MTGKGDMHAPVPGQGRSSEEAATVAGIDQMSGMVLHLLPEDISRGAQTFARSLRDRLDGRDGLTHRTLSLFAAPSAVLEADERLDVRAGRWRGLGFHPRVAWALRKRLAALGPDVVVAHGGEPLKYLQLAGAGQAGVVYHKIGMYGFPVGRGPRSRFHRWLVRRCDTVVGVSDEALDEVRALLGASGRDGPDLCVVPNGRDPGEFQPRRSDDGPPRLVSVGQISPEKRPELFVAAVRAVRDRGIAVTACLVGDGRPSPELAGAARRAGVELLGRRDDVPAILSGSDVLVLTSRTEGMPGVLIEAGLSGLPSVTTAVPGAGTVVEDGTTGFVVPLDDRGALVDALARLAGDADLRRKMGAAARERCLANFTLKASSDAWNDVLVGMRRGRRQPRARS